MAMIEKYKSVSGECRTVKIIEKSRFITTSHHVEGEDESRDFIAEVSKEYGDATHNCYAYICDSLGNFLRFSDDGEPQGTAGMPMLEVIKNEGLLQVAVVVTRYFGGVKLGAGGLVRAYSGCVAENLDAAQKVLYETCSQLEITADYSYIDTLTRYFNETNADVLYREYSNEVIFGVAIKRCDEDNFVRELINRLNGRIKVKKIKEYFFPFKI